MDNKFELINKLIYEHDCSLKVFNARYDRGIYVILGYDHLIEDIEGLLTGGDMDWDYCSCKLGEYDNLPIVLVFPEDNVILGLKKIEEIIFNNIKDNTLKEYLSITSRIYSDIIN